MNCVMAFDPEGFQAAQSDITVSLTPEASYFFERQAVRYSLLGDFYHESGFFGSEHNESYFKVQMEFMAEMDGFYRQRSRLCREFAIPLCSANYMKIAYAMDTVNINGWALERFFDAHAGIRSVRLLMGQAPIGEASPSFFVFRASRKAVFATVLERVCAKRGILFTAVGPSPNPPHTAASAPPLRKARESVKDWLKIPYRYLSYRKFSRAFRTSPGALLFLHHGAYEIDHFVRQGIAGGVRVFVREGRRVILENSALRSSFSVDPGKGSDELRRDMALCAEDMRQRPDTWFSRLKAASLWDGAADVLAPLFIRYTENEALRMLANAESWKRPIEENRIDAVLARGNTDLDSLAVLIAARHLCSIKTVCIQHAPSGLEGEAMNIYDGVTFDYILARDPVTFAYFKERGRDDSRLGWSGHYLNHLRKAAQKRPPRNPEKIAYLPKKFHEDLRCISEYSYSYVWYYEWQKKVMALFKKLKPQIFVYKHVPLQGWAGRSIIPYIRDLGADNIEFADAPFSKILGHYDRVITDYPSGAFFEALACGKSVLCVHPSHFKINPEATRLYGHCFAAFDTIDESLAIIEKFVRSDPNAYRATMPMEEMSLARLISKMTEAPPVRPAVLAGR